MENNFEQKREVHSNLKVLCILSYVWIGLSFLGAVYSLFSAITMTEEKREAVAEVYNNLKPGSGDALINQMKYAVPQNLSNLVLLVVSLFGVIMMNKLNRKGLIVYAIGELAGYILMFFMGGIAAMTSVFESFIGESSATAIGVVIVGILLILDLLFIYLYKNSLDKSNA